MSRATSYTEVTDTLKKPCKLRSEKELDSLIPWFQALSKTFSEIEKDVLKCILKESTFVSVPKRVAVIVQGEVGDCVYMILKGTVSVFVQTAQENERILLPPEMATCSLDSKILEGVYETEPLLANFNRTVFGNVFAEVGSGRIFGELAMMTKDHIRKASVISEDASDFLVVKRDSYKRLMLKQQTLELQQKREFLKYFPAFSEWSDRQVTNLALSLRMYQLKTGKEIVVQGKPFDGLHFIINGQAQISTNPNLHQRDFEKCFREKQQKNPKKKPSLFKPRRGSEFSEAANSFESEKKEPKPCLEQAINAISKRCPLNLCVMDAIGIVGDIEFMLGWNKYYSTVTCTEDCKILQLDKDDCFQLVTRSKRKSNYFLKLSRDKVAVLLRRWPGSCPVRLLMIALRELNKLLVPVPEARKEGTGRRKFMGDNNTPSLPIMSFMTNPDAKEKVERPEDSDSDDSVDVKNFIKKYRYSVSLNKEKIKDKKKRKEAMFGRGKNASKTPTLTNKGLKKLTKRETDYLNESQQRELAILEYRIHTWYDELEADLTIPADKCVPNLYVEDTFTPTDICRLLDEFHAGAVK